MKRAFHARAGLPLCALLGLVGCCSREAPQPAIAVTSQGAASGGPARRDDRTRSPTVRALEAGTLGPQDRTPVEQLLLVLDGYTRAKREAAGAPANGRHNRALFYCAQQNADFSQCVLFDGSDEGAHLSGVEYVISADLFATLPPLERQYWHAHGGEIDSGVLVAPGIDDSAHTELMGELRSTYGKGWRTWNAEVDPLPFGEPTLMWSTSPAKLEPAVRTEMRARRNREPE